MKKRKQVKIDIHGLTADEAYLELSSFLNGLDETVGKVIVVHGFHGGTILKQMVKEFSHYKIDWKEGSILNTGETILHLK